VRDEGVTLCVVLLIAPSRPDRIPGILFGGIFGGTGAHGDALRSLRQSAHYVVAGIVDRNKCYVNLVGNETGSI
jgi:hypothetical protein